MTMIDSTAIIFGVTGASLGLSTLVWKANQALQIRCDFFEDMDEDIATSFDIADSILADKATPAVVRSVLIDLLYAYTVNDLGRTFALQMAVPPGDEGASESNPLSTALHALQDAHPQLQMSIQRTLMSLSFNLTFLHLADHIVVEKVSVNAAKNPNFMWDHLLNIPNEGTHA